ncbi:unnamed protein product [Arctogadus glacialis]
MKSPSLDGYDVLVEVRCLAQCFQVGPGEDIGVQTQSQTSSPLHYPPSQKMHNPLLPGNIRIKTVFLFSVLKWVLAGLRKYHTSPPIKPFQSGCRADVLFD